MKKFAKQFKLIFVCPCVDIYIYIYVWHNSRMPTFTVASTLVRIPFRWNISCSIHTNNYYMRHSLKYKLYDRPRYAERLKPRATVRACVCVWVFVGRFHPTRDSNASNPLFVQKTAPVPRVARGLKTTPRFFRSR